MNTGLGTAAQLLEKGHVGGIAAKAKNLSPGEVGIKWGVGGCSCRCWGRQEQGERDRLRCR